MCRLLKTLGTPSLCAFALAALAACSAGSGSALAPLSPTAPTTSTTSTDPVAAPEAVSSPAASSAATLDADEVAARAALLRSTSASTTLTNTNWAGVPKPVRLSGSSGAVGQTEPTAVTPQSYHGPDDGTSTESGAAGINFANPRGKPIGVVATHDIFLPQTQLQLPIAPARNNNWLDAPATRGIGWSCLEIGTRYYRGSNAKSTTSASVFVNDTCGGPGWTATADSAFWKQYVTPATRSRAAHYQLAIVDTIVLPSAAAKAALPLSPPGWHGRAQWNAELFNVVTRKWDVVYNVFGSNSEGGWTRYATHYQADSGQSVSCPHGLPTIGAANVAQVTTATGGTAGFSTADSSVFSPLAGETSFGSFGACFNPGVGPDGKTSPASNVFNLISPNNAWSVSNPH